MWWVFRVLHVRGIPPRGRRPLSAWASCRDVVTIGSAVVVSSYSAGSSSVGASLVSYSSAVLGDQTAGHLGAGELVTGVLLGV
jgi:hypothetical protein